MSEIQPINPQRHIIRVSMEDFQEVTAGGKRFMVLRDIGFAPDHVLSMLEFNTQHRRETGRRIMARISHVSRFEQKDGRAVVGLDEVWWGT